MNFFEGWAKEYKKTQGGDTDLLWPSETLIRVFRGDYTPGLDKNFQGKKVLDMGFGNGNNMVFLGSLGLDLHGVEVDEEICVLGKEKFAKLGLNSDLRVGTNHSIPFNDNTFDFLTSWNVLHYENTEEDIRKGLEEYKRVLKPGGRLFLSTTGPEHKILTDSETVGPHLYKIGREDEWRKGQIYFYFDSPTYIHYYFDPFFEDVHVGRTHDQLFTETLDWFIVTGVKGS